MENMKGYIVGGLPLHNRKLLNLYAPRAHVALSGTLNDLCKALSLSMSRSSDRFHPEVRTL